MSLNELGLELLKFQMNFPMDQPLDVQGSIENVQVHVDLEAYKQDWSYDKRPDYQLLEANKRLQELNVRNQYAQSVPSISAFANLGYATQSSNVGGIFKTNSNAKDDGTYGPDKWYPYSLFGVSLNVPIFSGLQRNYRVQQEKLSLQKINNNFINLESSIDLEIKRASVTYENALRTLTAQQQNTELAGKVASVTKIKYEQGIGSNIEVIDAEDSLRQAQTNYYSALFDAMIARVDLEKAYGKLIAKADSK